VSQSMVMESTANDGGVIPPLLQLNNEEVVFVRDCVDVVIGVYRLYGFDDTGFHRKGTYDHWIQCAAKWGDAVKFIKWKFAAFYAAHIKNSFKFLDSEGNYQTVSEQQELPISLIGDMDNPRVLIGGKGYKWMMMLKNKDFETFDSLLHTLLYAKKGAPRPNADVVRKSLFKTFKTLTEPVEQPRGQDLRTLPVEIPVDMSRGRIEYDLSEETVMRQFRRTVEELFSRAVYSDRDRIEPFFPSTSANYINSRSEGGVIGAILDDPALLQGLKTDQSLITLREEGKSWRSRRTVVDDTALRTSFVELYSRISEAVVAEDPYVKLVGLAEALKVRIISKEPPMHMTFLKPIQRKLWSTLKSHPCFKLIGEPVDHWFVQDRMGSKLKDDEKYLSVDYAAATDEMYSWVSAYLVNMISDVLDLSPRENAAFRAALIGHWIENPEDSNDVRGQTRGQLMGSVVSFPLLCIANAAICRWAKEISTGRSILLKDCPLAINGDDAILKINNVGRLAWEAIGRFCGLSPSIGKVYFSKYFLNINSTSYGYYENGWESEFLTRPNGDKYNRLAHFRLIKYVNLGLLYGLKRSGGAFGAEDADDFSSIGSRCRELISNCPEFLQERVLGQFIELMNKRGDKNPLKKYNLPWFIPERFNGLGLPSVGRFKASDKELRLARKVYENPKVYAPIAKPGVGSWKVWKYAIERMKDFKSSSFISSYYEGQTEASEASILGLFCVESLFRVKGIKDLFDSDTDSYKSMSRFYRSQSRQNKKALLDNKIKMPEPFNVARFPEIYDLKDIAILSVDNLWKQGLLAGESWM